VLGLGEVDEDELYAALDLLDRSQTSVEKVLAQRHLKDGVLVLYDVTSSYLDAVLGGDQRFAGAQERHLSISQAFSSSHSSWRASAA